MNLEIGSTRPVKLRELWGKETDFTRWLARKPEDLDRVLGIGLKHPRPEYSAGTFRVDIVAETYDGSIAIENQFGSSDHRHFGQLLTYIAHPDQETSQGIWIVESARDEHVKAVENLNEAATVRIWMVEVSAIRIGDSLPAPLFKIIVAPPEPGGPSDASTGAAADQGLNANQIRYRDFQRRLFDQADIKKIDSPFNELNPTPHQQRQTRACQPGLLYRVAASIKHGTARVLLSNMKPKDSPGTWLQAYDVLKAESEQIAQEFADDGPQQELYWWDDRSNNGRWGVTYKVSVNLDQPEEERLFELNQAAAAIKAVFGPRLEQLSADPKDAPLDEDET